MIIDIFDKIYTSIKGGNAVLDKLRVYSVFRFVVRVSANVILPCYFRITSNNNSYKLESSKKNNGRLIVTLTSFPARINKLWNVVETILRQTYKPDMIILWLSEKQFPNKDSIPKSLRRLEKRGLTIRIVPEDYRSHKKYYYCLRDFPNDHIVTIDDDVFYDSHLLERMMVLHEKYPNAVITNHAHKIIFDDRGHLMPYSQWEYHTNSSDNLFVIGMGGNLYPAHCMDKRADDIELAYDLTPTGDDIWLNAMVRLKGTRIVHGPYHFIEQIPVINLHNVTLNSINVGSDNDKQINRLRTYFIDNYNVDPFDR